MLSKQNAPRVDQTSQFREVMLNRKARVLRIKRTLWYTGMVIATFVWAFVAYSFIIDDVK